MQDNRRPLPPSNVSNPRSPGERDRMIRAHDRQVRRRKLPLVIPDECEKKDQPSGG